MKKPLVILFATLSLVALGQAPCPTTPNFMELNSSCVVCNYGRTSNPFMYTGIANTRHTLITTQGFDPNTGNKLPLIPEGKTSSIRLGNSQIGAEAEAITYHFNVEPNKALLSIKFAVVFQDPGHPQWEQPRFVVRILNEHNELVETCAEYDVTAQAGIPGFQTYSGMGTPVRWRDWTTIALDLSSYIDQNIKVQFITYDCGYSGHFGYAYFTAECLPNNLDLLACHNDTVFLDAPPFCESYLWTNGDTTSSTYYVVQSGIPLLASCKITSVTGCEFTLNAYISETPFTRDTTFYDTICEGDTYTKNYFDLPSQSRIGTFSHINSFYDLTTCSGLSTAYLHLTVKQRYFHIEDMICNGQNYSKYGFNFSQPPPGIIRDTITISQTDDCDSVIYLTLTISHSTYDLPDTIFGNKSPCTGEVEIYTIPNAEFFVRFNWSVPDDVNIIRGKNSHTIVLQFTNDATSDDLKLYAENGCGGDWLTLFVEPKESYYLSFVDSICSGNSYQKNGFDIPRQDSSEFKIFSQRYVSCDGCDSVRSLYLYVFPTPEVEIISSADVICVDDSVELHVVSHMQTVVFIDAKIGDILCTDETIETPENFPTSGKTAQGVIFWIDPDDTYCWVMDLRFTATAIWGKPDFIPNVQEIHPIIMISGMAWTLNDTAGYQNTLAMRNGIDTTVSWGRSSIVWRIDFDNGWFLPAYTQAVMLVANLPFIYQSFFIAGGHPPLTQLPIDGPISEVWRLWISAQSQANGDMAFVIDSSGRFFSIDKTSFQLVRSMRYFKLTK